MQAPPGQEITNQALHQLKAAVEAHFEEIKSRQGLVDVVASWRLWKLGRKFVPRDFERYPIKYFGIPRSASGYCENQMIGIGEL